MSDIGKPERATQNRVIKLLGFGGFEFWFWGRAKLIH